MSADASTDTAERVPDKWTLHDRVGHVLSVWFGCGHVPIAPGTAGTIGALPVYLLVRPFGPLAVVAVAFVLLFIGVWAAGTVVRRRRSHDPQIVVIDEVVGVLLTAAALPKVEDGFGWRGIAIAFVLFRIFDQFKPFPARRAESLPRGWGVMMDDVFAGIWGAAIVLAFRAFGPPAVFS